MHLEQKLILLDQLYCFYDQYISSIDIACRATCCDCCTCNVTLTTLEAHAALNYLTDEQRPRMAEFLNDRLSRPRFIPLATFNQIADLCVSGMEPPEEAIDVSWGPCPLLTDRQCPVYAARPFGCRCLISTRPCRKTGAAEMDEFTATVNTLFFQVIEHIDQDGFSGNLSDVLAHVISQHRDYPDQYRSSRPHLIKNSPLRNLMIPPEHQDRLMPILHQIRALPI
jgi:hypothetical protein